MKQSQGWGQVIRFDAFKRPDQLTPQQQAEHTACSLLNDFIEIFNTNPIATRLGCVASLAALVPTLFVMAVMAGFKKLPYVEPTQLSGDNGKPLFYLDDTKPESETASE